MAPARADQGARLKNNHHSTISKAKRSDPRTAWRNIVGKTRGKTNLTSTSRIARATPGHSRIAFAGVAAGCAKAMCVTISHSTIAVEEAPRHTASRERATPRRAPGRSPRDQGPRRSARRITPSGPSQPASCTRNSNRHGGLGGGDIVETVKGRSAQVEVRAPVKSPRGRDFRRKLVGRNLLL